MNNAHSHFINRKLFIYLSIILVLTIMAGIIYSLIKANTPKVFSGEEAYRFIEYQMNLGPRIPGSSAHQKFIVWATDELEKSGWDVTVQETKNGDIQIKNLIAKRGSGSPWIILGSHYDSRQFADRDTTPVGQKQPVPGANDGASSVAVLMEVAKVIPKNLQYQVWLVFFDAEDLSGNQIAVGSQYFVSQLQNKPDQVIIFDMVGDKDLNIYMEKNSDADLNNQIWNVAAQLGYTQFIPQYKYRLLDDHVPFVRAGIKAVDIIDFDYPYWHTSQDTLDKVSAESLKIVGDVVLGWIKSLTAQQ